MSPIIEIILKYRRPLIVLFQLGLMILSYYFVFLLRFDFTFPVAYAPIFFKTLPVLIAIKLTVFYFFGLYQGLWRYVSMNDLWQILKANCMASLLFMTAEIFIFGLQGFPRSVFILDFILCTFLIAGVRFLNRLVRERYRLDLPVKRKKVLIVGAGQAGILTLKEYRNNPGSGEVVGFIDDDRVKHNTTIDGTPIFGSRDKIPGLVNEYDVEEIILAIPSAKGQDIRDILSYCQVPNVRIKIVPGLHKILNGELEIKPRQVRPDDLLGREVVEIDKRDVESYVKNKRVLVTGAGGSIGSELCRQIVNFSPEKIILLDHNENGVYFLEVEFKVKYPHIKFSTVIGNIRDVGLLKQVFSLYRPQVVFHAAAHKHVPLMERNPLAAVKNNVIGTRNLIYAAAHYRIDRFVLISTDKAVNPTSVMGATKRIAEMLLQAKSKKSRTKFMAVRFGNVIGSDGSVVPLFKKQIEEGGPVTVTDPEVKRYFMSISEAASLVLQAGALGKGGEIFILDMGEQVKISDLAKNLIALSGSDVPIQFTGLRPGEKLYEEMLLNTESDSVTKHNKIYITKSPDYNPAKLRKKIKEMERLIKVSDVKKTMQLISELVSTYKPAKETTV
jgi:FlaA1/EpsC-like NDP-sugar epimerase